MTLTKTLHINLFLSLFILFSSTGFTTDNPYKYDLLLKAGNINLHENLEKYITTFSSADQKTFAGYYHKIVQFREIPLQNEIETMKAAGMDFLEYIPGFAYIVGFPTEFKVENLRNMNVRSVTEITVPFKLDPALLNKDYPDHALPGDGYIELIVSFYRNVPYHIATSHLSHFIAMVLQDDVPGYYQIVRVNIHDIERIAGLPFVQNLEPVYPPGEPENYTGKTLHRSNVLDSQYPSGRKYDGEGIRVMLQDDGIIGPHIDYEGRIGAQYLTSNSGNHGDHCAGTIFGAGNLNPTAAGMAPGATLYVYGAAPLYPGFNSIPTHYNNPGIRISSTSYSNGCNAGYTTLARTLDIHINQYPSLMHVFSAGNAGTDNCGYGAGSGWGNVTGGHKIAKNVIAVANVTATDNLANSSSRGPAHDGRIKPEISAKGTNVVSTIDPHSYASFTGTSMACPGVAGSLAQLYHAYKELNAGNEPMGGLMKAIILNTADDLGNVGPDFRFGFGRINNLRAVKALEEGRHFTDQITQGITHNHNIIIPAGVMEVKVMVYWTDKEANTNANKALVNDINITLTDPSTNVHYPWVLSHFPHPDSLNKPASKGIDNLNNMEQVSINNPTAGNYTLTVNGFQIPFGPQEYYVVYDFLMDEIVVTYPIGGESFEPGESIMVRWDAKGVQTAFTIDYSLDNGENWITATTSVNPALRHYYLTAPNTVTGKALIRISAAGMSGISEAPFSIIGIPSNFVFESSCPDAVLLKWNTVPGATSYDLFMLGEKYMELAGSTSNDSLWISPVNALNESWFSIRAIGPEDAVGRRALAKLKSPGIWNCVFTKDLALTDIISPPPGVLFGCQNYDDLNLMIEITNFGIDDFSNITAYYQLNNGAVIGEPIPGIIQSGQSTVFEFASSISLPVSGNIPIKAWIEAEGDQNSFNDLIQGVYKMKPSVIAPVFFNYDFDDFSSCGYDPLCEDVVCFINNQWYNLENGVNDEIDWRLLNGITPTSGTGPVGDHTTGGPDGMFLYLEPTGDCFGKKAILMSPCFDLSNVSSPALSFWYNMRGAHMGSLHIDVVCDGILIKDVMVPISGDQGFGWKEAIVSLDDFSNKIINIRFRGYTGHGEQSDLAIDDVMITNITGLQTSQSSIDYQVFPNPSDGKFTVSFGKEITSLFQAKVFDMTGRTLIAETIEINQSGNNSYSFDLSMLDKGVYFLICEGDGFSIFEKIIIQ